MRQLPSSVIVRIYSIKSPFAVAFHLRTIRTDDICLKILVMPLSVTLLQAMFLSWIVR